MSYGIDHQVGIKASPDEIYKYLTENIEEKLSLALHRNFFILLGKLPLRQIAIKLGCWPKDLGSKFIALRTSYGQLGVGK